MEDEIKERWSNCLCLVLAILFMIKKFKHKDGLRYYFYEPNENYNCAISSFSAAPTAVVITLALVMLAAGATGLRALYTEDIHVLKWFFYVSLVLVLLELIGGLLCFVYGESVAIQLAESLNFNVSSYNVDYTKVIVDSVDNLQREFECCGYKNFREWKDNPVYTCQSDTSYCPLPSSCCFPQAESSCLYYKTNDSEVQAEFRGHVHGTGCWFAFAQWLEGNIDAVGITSLIAVSLKVVCCLAACWQVKYMKMKSATYRI